MSVIPGWFPAAVVGGRKNPSVRFVGGGYTLSVTGTTGNFVLNAADMGVPHPNRQYFMFIGSSGSSLASCTFNGTPVVCAPHRLDSGHNTWVGWVGGVHGTNTNLTVAISIHNSIGGETFQVAVFEVYDAPPFQKCPIYAGDAGGSIGFDCDNVHVPQYGMVIACAQRGGFSSSWTGATEVYDAQTGSNVGLTAAMAGPALAETDLNISVTNITQAEGTVIVIPPNYLPFPGVQLLDSRARNGSGTTITVTDAEIPSEVRGSWTLLVGVSYEKDGSPPTSATFGGVAMTMLGQTTLVQGANHDPQVALFAVTVTNNAPDGDLVITVSAGINSFTCWVTCWAVYDASFFGTYESNTGDGVASLTCQVDITTMGSIVAVVARNSDTVAATWTGASKINDIDQGANRAGSAQVHHLLSQTNRNITVTPGATDNMAMCAVAINR